MRNIWFTSDLHFDDQTILKHCPDRPWKNAQDMNNNLIQIYNESIKPNDDVWILGDFRPYDGLMHISTLRRLVNRLNGNKHLIIGNHDERPAMDYVAAGFSTVHTWFKVDEFNLIHDPATCIVLPNEKWLYGHLHQNVIINKNALNVGVDRWKMNPISIDQVREQFK